MKNSGGFKILLLSVCLLALIASCGPVTPIPSFATTSTVSLTVTRTPSQTPTFTLTSTQTEVPATPVFPALATPYQYGFDTPTPIALPLLKASDFRLMDWSDQDAVELVQLMGAYAHAADVVGVFESRGDLWLAQPPLKLAVQEALWRYPNSSYREALEWHLASPDIIMGNQDVDQWLASKIEGRLNSGEYDLSNINDFLANYGMGIFVWSLNEYKQTEVPNLFGDGKKGILFSVHATVGGTGSNEFLFAERINSDNSVSLIPISFLPRSVIPTDVKFFDLTNDNIPEIMFSSDICAGSCHPYRAYIFYWDGARFVEVTNGKIYDDDLPVSNWEIGPLDENQNNTILMTYESPSTLKPFIQEVYEWNGANYELVSQNVMGQNAPDAGFYALVNKIKTVQSQEMVTLLQESGIRVLGARSVDLNSDDQNDWVVLTDAPALWVLISSGENYVPFKIEDYFLKDVPSSNIKVDQVELIEGRLVSIIKVGDFMRLLSVLNLKSGPAVVNYWTPITVHVVGYAIVSVNDKPAIKIFYPYPPNSWENYQWNDTMEQFEMIDVYRTSREQQEYNAIQDSQLVLSENRGQVNKSLNQYLSLPKEICAEDDWMCQERVENLPRLWYMLGLAYELDGNVDLAVKTYWQLWRDYPESPYAIMAQYKLEPIRP